MKFFKRKKKQNESEESEIMATKEEIYEKLNKLIKKNHLKLSKENLSRIKSFKILRIKKEHGINTIEYKLKYDNETFKHSPSSNMYKAEDWASFIYGTEADPGEFKILKICKKID